MLVIQKYLENLTPENPNYKLTYRLMTPKGNLKYLKTLTNCSFNEDGEIIKTVGFVQDVTEETLAHQEALELKENINEIQGFSKIFICTVENGEFSYTPEVYNILKVSPEEYSDNDLMDFLVPECKKELEKRIGEVSYENPNFTITYRLHTPEGELRIFKAFALGKFSEDKELLKLIAFVQDVTEETLKNQEALELKENLDDTLGANKMFIGTFENGKFTYTDSVYDVGEGKKGECDPDELVDRIYPEDLKLIYEGYDNITKDNPSFNLKYRIITLKNNLKYLKIFATGRFDKNGELIKIINIVQDVTEETLIQQEATKLRDDFAVIQDSSKVVIAGYENGKYSWTSEIHNILGINKEDYSPEVNLISQFILPEDEKSFNDFMTLTYKNQDKQVIVRIKRPDGEIRYLDINNRGKFDSDKKLLKMVGFIKDITKETLVQQEATKLRDNFAVI